MKYLKTFEDRDEIFKYLNKEDENKVEIFVTDYIKNLDITDKIKNLKLKDFESTGFDYEFIFNNFLTATYYSTGNIFYEIDRYFMNINLSLPALRNSLFDMFNKLYKKYNTEYKFDDKLDKKLIKLLEENPSEYKDFLKSFDDEINDNVKKSCKWMLDYHNYNL